MIKNILWLGGWASNLLCWEKDFSLLYPQQKHFFIDTHALIENPKSFYANISELPADTLIAAWSLGSLFMHKQMMQGNWNLSNPILSICPIFDFCSTQSQENWSANILQKMQKKLEEEKIQVLQDFWNRLSQKEKTAVPIAKLSEMERTWIEQSQNYSIVSLQTGLKYLADEKTAPEKLLPWAKQIYFVMMRSDPISPFIYSLSDDPWHTLILAQGHLPFFSYADTFREFFLDEHF